MEVENLVSKPYPLEISVTLGIPDEYHPFEPEVTEVFVLALQPTENAWALEIASELDVLATTADGYRIPNRFRLEFEQYNWGAENLIFEMVQQLGAAAGDAVLGAAIIRLLEGLAGKYHANVYASLDDAIPEVKHRLLMQNPGESTSGLTMTAAGDAPTETRGWTIHFLSSTTGRRYEVTVHRNGVMRFLTHFPTTGPAQRSQ